MAVFLIINTQNVHKQLPEKCLFKELKMFGIVTSRAHSDILEHTFIYLLYPFPTLQHFLFKFIHICYWL